MRAKTQIIYDGVLAPHIVQPHQEQEYWHAIVTLDKDDIVDTIDVKMNPDTVVCQVVSDDPSREENFKTYAWQGLGHIETEATIAALKYAEWLMTHGAPKDGELASQA